ncbi:unnamed protein product [Anisakis simplex]|uniref:Hormone-sensitive lipase (inferred by orthology to a human protein) n=1 Tax=Anisakis simplex TaxID=6269 RepID=A0A0M3JYA6_ANISI|nr:unnamed protein product [Anisakis simplex]
MNMIKTVIASSSGASSSDDRRHQTVNTHSSTNNKSYSRYCAYHMNRGRIRRKFDNSNMDNDSDSNNNNSNQLGPKLSVQRSAIFALLEKLAEENERYFMKQSVNSDYMKRLQKASNEILACSSTIQRVIHELQTLAPKYDYDEKTPGNGFRSLICVCDQIVLHLISLLRDCSEYRHASLLSFHRISYLCRELESYCAAMKFVLLATQQVLETQEKLATDSLFPPLEDDYRKYEGLMKSIEALDASCFYGRPLGFQFTPSIGRIFRFIGVILATYSLSWEKGQSAFGSLISSGRFIVSPEERAARILKVTREADIDFCKGFWNLSELGNVSIIIIVSQLFCPNMAVNDVREINFIGPISMQSNQKINIGSNDEDDINTDNVSDNGIESASGSSLCVRSCSCRLSSKEKSGFGMVRIPEPSAHTGVRPVRLRVLSYAHREALNRPATSTSFISPSSSSSSKFRTAQHESLSPYLLFHCHGGGYVATTSKSHETYLRTWAKQLNCPVVSIDYSLAPENPYPRPTEEVLYAYAYIVNNPSEFGWTGERLCMVGDSAGGNLIMSVNLRLIELNVKRKPDGLVLCYTPFLFQYLPSPSRLLSFMDPLLHMGVVLRCVDAYTRQTNEIDSESSTSSNSAVRASCKNCNTSTASLSSSGNHKTDQTNRRHKSLLEYVEQVQRAAQQKRTAAAAAATAAATRRNGMRSGVLSADHRAKSTAHNFESSNRHSVYCDRGSNRERSANCDEGTNCDRVANRGRSANCGESTNCDRVANRGRRTMKSLSERLIERVRVGALKGCSSSIVSLLNLAGTPPDGTAALATTTPRSATLSTGLSAAAAASQATSSSLSESSESESVASSSPFPSPLQSPSDAQPPTRIDQLTTQQQRPQETIPKDSEGVSEVQNKATDPLSIHISSSSPYHRKLIRYLRSHQLTKHSLTIINKNGSVMEGDDADDSNETSEVNADLEDNFNMNNSNNINNNNNATSVDAVESGPQQGSSTTADNQEVTQGEEGRHGEEHDDVHAVKRDDLSLNLTAKKFVMRTRTAHLTALAIDNISNWFHRKETQIEADNNGNQNVVNTTVVEDSGDDKTDDAARDINGDDYGIDNVYNNGDINIHNNNDKLKLDRTSNKLFGVLRRNNAHRHHDNYNSNNNGNGSNNNGNCDNVEQIKVDGFGAMKDSCGDSNRCDETEYNQGESGSSQLENLLRRDVPREPLISPIYASAEQLKQLPPMWFIACHMDPLLDDTIEFARKVRASDGRVGGLDLLESLPHGFLNFTLMSEECRDAAKLCLMRIREAFGMGMKRNKTTLHSAQKLSSEANEHDYSFKRASSATDNMDELLSDDQK